MRRAPTRLAALESAGMSEAPVVRYEVTDRVARITLDRPERGNAITPRLISELVACVERADLDPAVHVLVLAGEGPGFCGGYDLVESAEGMGAHAPAQAAGPSGSPLAPAVMAANHDPSGTWDPMVDYAMMGRNVRGFMSLFNCGKPVVCRVHGFCVAGGTDMALCSDLLVIAEDAKIGYPPARVWGSPTTALWAHRVGAQRAKRLLFTGDSLSGSEAVEWGLAIEAPPAERLVERTEILLARIARVPVNQLMMMKLLVNQTIYAQGLHGSAGARHGVRRDRSPHGRGLRLPAPRRTSRIPRGGARARRAVRRSGPLDLQGLDAHLRSCARGDRSALSRPLGRELQRLFPSRPFHVRFWDGGAVPATVAEAPTFFVRRPVGARRTSFARPARSVSVAPTSTARWPSTTSTARSLVVDEWEPPELSVADRVRLGLAIGRRGRARRDSAAARAWSCMLRGELHSAERDAEAVRYHYDVGNDFFALFLDESMTYSCAIFSQRRADARGGAAREARAGREQARAAAGDASAGRRLRLGQLRDPRRARARRGWCTGITLSAPQAELARERVARGGRRATRSRSASPTTASCRDRRSTRSRASACPSTSASSQIDVYAQLAVRRCCGRAGCSSTMRSPRSTPSTNRSRICSRRATCSPTASPCRSRASSSRSSAPAFDTEHVEGFREDYAVTLRHWASGWTSTWTRPRRSPASSAPRVWRLYLRAAGHGFEAGLTAVYQVRARRPL